MTRFCVVLTVIISLTSCKRTVDDPYIWKEIKVKATAYNSLSYQTSSNPSIAAWGDSLKPGMKCIAVSRDLIKLGLKHNTPVKIQGLDSIYLVKDKMHKRKRNQIDIYMGKDVKKAKKWGVQRLKIKYGIPKDSVNRAN
jgi:3D (Asp-Asp-Asp) domain-containing protein